MELTRQKCKKAGFERYVDLYLVWEHDGKQYKVRVQPVFNTDFKYLLAHAKDMDKTSD